MCSADGWIDGIDDWSINMGNGNWIGQMAMDIWMDSFIKHDICEWEILAVSIFLSTCTMEGMIDMEHRHI